MARRRHYRIKKRQSYKKVIKTIGNVFSWPFRQVGRFFKWAFSHFTKKAKGRGGEAKVSDVLRKLGKEKTAHKYIDNLILLDENGISHQIDHVVIRRNGIFCLETKNLSGILKGKEDDYTWRCYLRRKAIQINNPIRQNNGHVYALLRVLGKKHPINSLVVLVQNNKGFIESEKVISLRDLRKYLVDFDDRTNLSSEEVEEIYKKLSDARADVSDKEHIKSIKKRIEENEKSGKCPRCGREIVKREGKYGQFYSCSGYPKCKYKVSGIYKK